VYTQTKKGLLQECQATRCFLLPQPKRDKVQLYEPSNPLHKVIEETWRNNQSRFAACRNLRHCPQWRMALEIPVIRRIMARLVTSNDNLQEINQTLKATTNSGSRWATIRLPYCTDSRVIPRGGSPTTHTPAIGRLTHHPYPGNGRLTHHPYPGNGRLTHHPYPGNWEAHPPPIPRQWEAHPPPIPRQWEAHPPPIPRQLFSSLLFRTVEFPLPSCAALPL
jgi:hypothetical protein